MTRLDKQKLKELFHFKCNLNKFTWFTDASKTELQRQGQLIEFVPHLLRMKRAMQKLHQTLTKMSFFTGGSNRGSTTDRPENSVDMSFHLEKDLVLDHSFDFWDHFYLVTFVF